MCLHGTLRAEKQHLIHMTPCARVHATVAPVLLLIMIHSQKLKKKWVRTLSHAPAQPGAGWGACFRSIHFDHGLISALLIKFSICFIVNEVKRAGAGSHRAKKTTKTQRGTSEKAIKGRKEERVVERESAIKKLNRQNIITGNKSKKRACLVSVTNAKLRQSEFLSGRF